MILRLLVVGSFAFASAWGILCWEGRAEPRASVPAPRKVVFNGVQSTVALSRETGSPGQVLEAETAALVARGLSGRELDEGAAPLDQGEREAFRAGRFFLVFRSGGAFRVLARRGGMATEVFLRPDGEGTAVLRSEREGEPWLPDGGDCPGRDPEGLRRPEGWLRLFCVESPGHGGGGLLVCYGAPEAPEEALALLSRRMEEGGWESRSREPLKVHVRKGVRAVLSSSGGTGGTQVSVMIAPPTGP